MDVVFALVDFGDPYYFECTHYFIDTCRKVMPKARIIELTDLFTPYVEEVDAREIIAPKLTKETFIKNRSEAFAKYGLKTKNNTIFTDVDTLWNRSCEEIFDKDFDIGVLWRKELVMQRYLGCLIFSKPTEGARSFWKAYLQAVEELKKVPKLEEWYGDQIILSALIGQALPGTTVKTCGASVLIFDCNEIAFDPKIDQLTKKPSQYISMFKGYSKWEIKQYYNYLLEMSKE